MKRVLKTENFTDEIRKVINNLNNSYLYLQGPPGSGKTYQAMNAILELIKRNGKIAVTAQSHKVIHNLLGENKKAMAKSKKHTFKGLKMGNVENDDTFFLMENLLKQKKMKKHFINQLKRNDKT